MPLQTTTVSVDFTKSLDQRTSSKLVLAGKLTTATDMVFRGKAIERRSGFTALSQTIYGGTSLSTETSLLGYVLGNTVAVQGKKFYTYDSKKTQWSSHSTGINPLAITKAIAYRSARPVTWTAMESTNGYTCYLVVTAPTSGTTAVEARIIDETTGAQVGDVTILDTSSTVNIVQVAAKSNVFIAVWLRGSTQVFGSTFDTTNPNGGWAVINLVTSSNAANGLAAISVNNRVFIVNRQGAGSTAQVEELDTNLAILAGPVDTTMPAGAGCFIASSNDGFLYVLAFDTNTLRRTVLNLSLTITQASATVDTPNTANSSNSAAGFPLAASSDIYYSFGADTNNNRVRFVNLTSGGTIGTLRNFVRGSAVATTPFQDGAGRRYIWLFSRWGIVGGAPNSGQNTLGQSLGLFEDTKKDGTAARFVGQALYGSARFTFTLGLNPIAVRTDNNGNAFTIALDQFVLSLASGTATNAVGIARLTTNTQAPALQKALFGGLALQACGSPSLFDGSDPVEMGFPQYPEVIRLQNVVGGGSLSAGAYQYALTYEWVDNLGNRWQSAATPTQSVTAALNDQTTITVPYLRWTNKVSPRADVRIVIWRTVSNGSTLFRLTPLTNSIVNDTTNDTTTYTDAAADSSINSNEILYTAGALANIVPPASRYAVAHQNRLFLLGLEDSNLLWYSRKYVAGGGINFDDSFTLRVNPWGGDITGGASMDDKLIVFEQTATAVLYGDGPNDLGSNNTFVTPQLVSQDIGCADARSIVSTPFGVLFLSNKGFYLLDRGLQMRYLGAAVENLIKPLGFTGVPAITSVQLLQDRSQVRWTLKPVGIFSPTGYVVDSPGVCLVCDYTDVLAADADEISDKFKWTTFTNYYASDAVIWNGSYIQIGSNNIVKVDSESANSDASTTTQGIVGVAETGWIKVKGVQDFQRVVRALFTGATNGSNHSFTVYIAYDYIPNFVESFSVGPLGITEPWQFRHMLSYKQKCEAIKFRIISSQETTAKFSIENLTLELGTKKGAFKLPASATV